MGLYNSWFIGFASHLFLQFYRVDFVLLRCDASNHQKSGLVTSIDNRNHTVRKCNCCRKHFPWHDWISVDYQTIPQSKSITDLIAPNSFYFISHFCVQYLTASELHVIMTSGFATVSGNNSLNVQILCYALRCVIIIRLVRLHNDRIIWVRKWLDSINQSINKLISIVLGTVLAAYMNFGAEASHLITSSVMAAPATLAFSKLIYPETEVSQTTSKSFSMEKS